MLKNNKPIEQDKLIERQCMFNKRQNYSLTSVLASTQAIASNTTIPRRKRIREHEAPEFLAYKANMGFKPLPKPDTSTIDIVTSIMNTTKELCSSHDNPILNAGEELAALYEIAFGLHDESSLEGHIVQCGTYRGGTAAVLATAIRNRGINTPMITMDHFRDTPHGDKETTDDVFIAHKRLFEALELRDYVVSVYHEDVSYLSKFWNFPLRMSVIDSLHSFKHTRDEINAIAPHIIFGGWLCFHDYSPAIASGGVVRAIDEWLPTLNRPYQLFEVPVFTFIRLL